MTGADIVLQGGLLFDLARTAFLGVLGFSLLAGVTALCAAFIYRRGTTRMIPPGGGIILGVVPVAAWLNYRAFSTGTVVADMALLSRSTGYFLVGTITFGTVAAEGGRRLGDYIASDVFSIERIGVTSEVAELVQSAGTVVVVELPETIEDIEGYPAVDRSVIERLSGRRLLFPRRLSPPELEQRLQERIEEDFHVDHVDVTLTEDGQVSRLAVGRTERGLGPSIPPTEVALAVSSDPLPEADMGDPIEIWTTDSERNELVATGTFWADSGDVTTLVVGPDDAEALGVDGEYQLSTKAGIRDDGSEFVSLLRVADETITKRTVAGGGSLEGEFVGWVPMTVLAIDRDGESIPFPADRETLQTGDTLYALGTPDDIQTFDSAAA